MQSVFADNRKPVARIDTPPFRRIEKYFARKLLSPSREFRRGGRHQGDVAARPRQFRRRGEIAVRSGR